MKDTVSSGQGVPRPPPDPLAAVITAGGRSSRFGSDKALYVLNGRTLLQWVAGSLAACTPRLLIAPADTYRLDGWQTIADLRPGEGPLAGLETALTSLLRERPGGGWLAFSAVDLPHLTPDYWALLMASARQRSAGVLPQHSPLQAVAGQDETGRLQPLAALYHTRALPRVTELLDAGERRMKAALSSLEVEAVPWPSVAAVAPQAYVNFNRPPAER